MACGNNSVSRSALQSQPTGPAHPSLYLLSQLGRAAVAAATAQDAVQRVNQAKQAVRAATSPAAVRSALDAAQRALDAARRAGGEKGRIDKVQIRTLERQVEALRRLAKTREAEIKAQDEVQHRVLGHNLATPIDRLSRLNLGVVRAAAPSGPPPTPPDPDAQPPSHASRVSFEEAKRVDATTKLGIERAQTVAAVDSLINEARTSLMAAMAGLPRNQQQSLRDRLTRLEAQAARRKTTLATVASEADFSRDRRQAVTTPRASHDAAALLAEADRALKNGDASISAAKTPEDVSRIIRSVQSAVDKARRSAAPHKVQKLKAELAKLQRTAARRKANLTERHAGEGSSERQATEAAKQRQFPALRRYTSPKHYFSDLNHNTLNEALWSGTIEPNPDRPDKPDVAKVAAFSHELSAELRQLPAYQDIVYRGSGNRIYTESELARYMPGEVVIERCYLSTSLDSSEEFGGNAIWIISSRRGRLVDKLSEVDSEREVLFDRFSRFEVMHREEIEHAGRWRTLIYMEEL